MPTPPPESMRQRKKRRTRETIADAALALFLDRGFDAVTVTEVAAAADVSEKTVFNHFSCKEELLFDLDPDIEGRIVDLVRHRAPGVSVIESLRAFGRGDLGTLVGVLAATAPEADARQAARQAAFNRINEPGARERFRAMILASPTLIAYQTVRASRYEASLRDALLAEIAGDDLRARAEAHVLAAAVTAALRLEFESGASPQAGGPRRQTLTAGLDILERGFEGWLRRPEG